MKSTPASWFTLHQVAQFCGVGYKTAHRWTRIEVRGRLLISTLVGGRRRVSREQLHNFLRGEKAMISNQVDAGARERAVDEELDDLLPRSQLCGERAKFSKSDDAAARKRELDEEIDSLPPRRQKEDHPPDAKGV